MSLTLVTAPSVSPVSLDEAKLHLRVTASAEDALITALIQSAVQDAEHKMQRAICGQQWRLTLDQWPYDCGVSGIVWLQRGRVTSVDSIRYADASTGVMTTLASTEWQADLSGEHMGRLMPAYGKVWPLTRRQLAAVEILFTAGWATAPEVPAVIKSWLLLRIGALYENREAWTLGKPIEENPFTDRLLDRYTLTTA